MKRILQGNEAIARGAWEAGVTVGCAYPGTPSSEIMSELARYPEVYTEWSTNEKVSLEVAFGAAMAGGRALVAMKHVGLNVAADPLMTMAYTGVKGGLVVVVADDPGQHSSQNEQDSRHWTRFGKVPMLEPADSQECRDFTRVAFDMSERFDTPVLVRSETRVSHSDSPVETGERTESTLPKGLSRADAPKQVMVPAYARLRRVEIDRRMERLEAYAEEEFPGNVTEFGDLSVGIIASGVSYLYAKELFPGYSFLKLGMVWPLPRKRIAEFCRKVKKVIVVEELDPFLETEIRAMGIKVRHGKDLIPSIGELTPAILEASLAKAVTGRKSRAARPRALAGELPGRPPNFCAGCGHRPLFYALKKLGVFVFGDIGCYTLGFLPPLSAMDACVCMGASVTMAHGMAKALGEGGKGKVVAVLGDSTFMHSGITGLLNAVYNGSYASVIILDNRTTAMTGHQPNPANGKGIRGNAAPELDLEKLCQALGVKRVVVVNPHDVENTRKVLKEEIESPDLSVIISRAPCVLLPEELRRKKPVYYTRTENCTGCTLCVNMGCPAISWTPLSPEEAVAKGYREKQKGFAAITEVQCNGCGQCAAVCKFEAITRREEIA